MSIALIALLLAAAVVVVAGVLFAAAYFADAFTRPKRRRVEGSPADLGLRHEDVQFAAPDGAMLRGWYLESPGARASVILLHDIEGTRSDSTHGLLRLQRDYVSRGFNVLAFDLRGRGESAGCRDHCGGVELRDVIGAVGWMRARSPRVPVLLHGFGLGASLAIVAAADGLPIDGIIADSPFASARGYLRHRWSHVPAPLFALSAWLARRFFNADLHALAPIDVAWRVAPARILFIHGAEDDEVPVGHTLNLAAASINAGDEMWLVDGVGHCGAYLAGPQTYMRRCMRFIDGIVPMRQPAVAVG